MTDKKYNGWANYETWVVKLWMDNSADSYQYYKDVTSTFKDDAVGLADALKQEFHDGNPITEANVWADLMNSALSEVDWYEIAKSLLDDAEAEERESRDDKDYPAEEDVDYLRDIGEDK